MFDSELREQRQLVRQLESKIESIVSRYESNLRTLQSEFKKIDSVAEKQIADEISSLSSEIEKILKDFEHQIDLELKKSQKDIAQQESYAIRSLQDYKKSCVDSFTEKTRKMILIKGEL